MFWFGVCPTGHIRRGKQHDFLDISHVLSEYEVYDFGAAERVALQYKASFAERFEIVYRTLYVMNTVTKYFKTAAAMQPAIIVSKVADNAVSSGVYAEKRNTLAGIHFAQCIKKVILIPIAGHAVDVDGGDIAVGIREPTLEFDIVGGLEADKINGGERGCLHGLIIAVLGHPLCMPQK